MAILNAEQKHCQTFRSELGRNESSLRTTVLLLKGNLTLGESSVIRAPDIYFNIKSS